MTEHSQQPTDQSHDPTYFPMLYAIEDKHFWFRARNAILTSLVKQVVSDLPAGYCVLEVGCGTGNVLRFLN